MGAVKNLCKRGIVLNQGQVAFDGGVEEAVNFYQRNLNTIPNLNNIWTRANTSIKQPFQLINAKLSNKSGELQKVYSCDEDIICTLTISVKEKIPGIYGWFGILKASDNSQVWVSDSNDIEPNKLEKLPIGSTDVSLVIPHRTLAPGKYIIAVNFGSIFCIENFYADKIGNILSFEINDFSTNRGNSRMGSFSTLIDWEF